MKHIFNDFIYSLGMAIGLIVVGRTSDKMDAKAFMKFFPKTCHKDRPSIIYDGLWNTMIADYVGNV
jgi:hypothetical protein